LTRVFDAIEIRKQNKIIWVGLWAGIKTFRTKKKVEELLSNFEEMQSKVYLPSLERQSMFCFPLFCVIVF